MGRATQGVTLIGLDEGSKLGGLQRIVENDANPTEAEDASNASGAADEAGSSDLADDAGVAGDDLT
jgi:DNA gyrase subunit A